MNSIWDFCIGIFLIICFFLTGKVDLIAFKVLASLFYIVSSTIFMKISFKSYNKRHYDFQLFMMLISAFTLSLTTYFFHKWIIVESEYLLFFILLIVFLLVSIFFAMHVYMFSIYNKSKNEIFITSMIMSICGFLALLNYVYTHVIFLLLFILGLTIYIKANIDLAIIIKKYAIRKRRKEKAKK